MITYSISLIYQDKLAKSTLEKILQDLINVDEYEKASVVNYLIKNKLYDTIDIEKSTIKDILYPKIIDTITDSDDPEILDIGEDFLRFLKEKKIKLLSSVLSKIKNFKKIPIEDNKINTLYDKYYLESIEHYETILNELTTKI